MKTLALNRGLVAMVDDSDYEVISAYHWYFNGKYVVRNIWVKPNKYTTGYLHRMIMAPSDGLQVDHVNRNTLDNRRCNLRIVTASQNQMNRPVQKNNYSGIKGVFRKRTVVRGREYVYWAAYIHKDKTSMYLGLFKTKELAGDAYNEAAKRLHGEFACINQGKSHG